MMTQHADDVGILDIIIWYRVNISHYSTLISGDLQIVNVNAKFNFILNEISFLDYISLSMLWIFDKQEMPAQLHPSIEVLVFFSEYKVFSVMIYNHSIYI